MSLYTADLLHLYSTGEWSDEGLTTVIEKDTVVCKSTHLTSFAVLVDVSGSTNVRVYPNNICAWYYFIGSCSTPYDKDNFNFFQLQQFSADHRLALSIVTYIGCSLSLIALIITIIYFISLRYVWILV